MPEIPKIKAPENLRWWILITLIIGTFLGRLDQTIVNLALPKIISDFSITVSEVGWIATAYILANAIFVPIWGKLGDTIGRKKVYLWGFAIFIFGSVLAALSWDLNSMLVFRVIQAIASSADYPTAMALLTVTFKEGRERAQALGLWSVSFAASAVFGPLIGGPLIDNFGWRSIFWINLPVGILGIVMASIFIKESVSEKKTVKFDWAGAITLGASLSSLVLVLDKGLEWGWLSQNSILCYIAIVAFAIIFYLIDVNHTEPIIDFKFFKISAFNGALINNFITFMGMMGGIFLLPVFLQTFLGYNATETGYVFIPMALFMGVSAQIGGRLTGRVAPNVVIAVSTFVAGIGLLSFITLDPRSSAIEVMVPLGIMAFGMGLGMAQRTNIIASAVPDREIGMASSILALVRNISGAFGIALFATILNEATKTNQLLIVQNSVINSVNPAIISQATVLMSLKAQIVSFHTIFIIAAAITMFAAVLAFFMLKVRETASGKEIFID